MFESNLAENRYVAREAADGLAVAGAGKAPSPEPARVLSLVSAPRSSANAPRAVLMRRRRPRLAKFHDDSATLFRPFRIY